MKPAFPLRCTKLRNEDSFLERNACDHRQDAAPLHLYGRFSRRAVPPDLPMYIGILEVNFTVADPTS